MSVCYSPHPTKAARRQPCFLAQQHPEWHCVCITFYRPSTCLPCVVLLGTLRCHVIALQVAEGSPGARFAADLRAGVVIVAIDNVRVVRMDRRDVGVLMNSSDTHVLHLVDPDTGDDVAAIVDSSNADAVAATVDHGNGDDVAIMDTCNGSADHLMLFQNYLQVFM